jgi:hypothetical protein
MTHSLEETIRDFGARHEGQTGKRLRASDLRFLRPRIKIARNVFFFSIFFILAESMQAHLSAGTGRVGL